MLNVVHSIATESYGGLWFLLAIVYFVIAAIAFAGWLISAASAEWITSKLLREPKLAGRTRVIAYTVHASVFVITVTATYLVDRIHGETLHLFSVLGIFFAFSQIYFLTFRLLHRELNRR